MAFKNIKRNSNLKQCGFNQYKMEQLGPRLMMDGVGVLGGLPLRRRGSGRQG